MRRLRIAVALAVTAVWAIAYLRLVFFDGATTLGAEATGVMLLVAAWLFGMDAVGRKR